MNSNGIDKSKVLRAYGSDYLSKNTSVNFTIPFRNCIPGEWITNSICEVCKPQSFSLFNDSDVCTECFSNVVCEGSNNIQVDPGFWRMYQNSSNIYACYYNKACLGGLNFSSLYPVNCKEGYEGILCHSCSYVEGERYMR